MRRLHIFRAGTHTPMGGGTLEFSAADLDATARAYDPARHEAPIVVGHPRLDAPAYGWIGTLAAEDGGLFAAPRQVEPAFAAMVEAGRFKKISAAFFKPDHPRNPSPGSYYLKHVGFLGAVPPAIEGLKPVEFGAEDDGALTVEFAADGWRLGWIFSDLAALLRGVRDHLVEKEGAEAADKVMPGATVQRLAEEAARLQAESLADASPVPGFADPTPPTTKDTAVSEQELAARQRELEEREAAFAAREREARGREDRAFADGLVKEARLPAGLVPRVVAFMGALGEEGEVSFAGADGKPAKETPREALRAILQALPKTVAFGAVAGGEGPGDANGGTAEFAGHRADPDRMELHRKALAYQKAHPDTDYLAAALAVENAG